MQESEALRESEENYRHLIENSHDIIYKLSSEGMFTFVSPSWTVLLGHPINQVEGKAFMPFIHPDDLPACTAWMGKVLSTGLRQTGIEYRVRHVDGSWRWHSSSAVPLKDKSGVIVGFEGIASDIHEHKEAEEQIKRLLVEKELLLREVHHRIKNNMNTMMSLLSLQSRTMRDPLAMAALEDAGARLRSMATLYDKLYRSENFKEISARDYLPSLMKEIMEVFPGSAKVRVETQIADFVFHVKELASLGILVNEILTNTMKYAFAGRAQGLVRVTASNEENRVTVTVEDDGVGIPESVDIDNSTGFGLMLVGTLAKQMNGTIRIERGCGTKFVLEFER